MVHSFGGLVLVFAFIVAPTSIQACETLVHLEKLVKAHKESTDTCNRQNYNLHFVCSLLTAQNFRKYF